MTESANPRPMRILVVLPVYGRAPTGAFVTTREYVQHLAAAGHEVQVVTTGRREPGRPRTVDGVRVWPLGYWRHALQTVRPELLITHHGDRAATRIAAQATSIPHLLMVHGMSKNLDLGAPGLAWFPSQACRDHYPYEGPALVLPPPINPARYRTEPGDLVTLNGSTAAKGADVLAAVAARMPKTRFLVVRAAGHIPDAMPPNVTLIDRTDPREVYGRTRIALLPSTVESYGRAGVEAMLSGIPVIAAPLPGMREAFAGAATYIPREDTGQWVTEIRRLSHPAAYAKASARARAHADALDYAGNLAEFEAACLSLRSRPRRVMAGASSMARRPALAR